MNKISLNYLDYRLERKYYAEIIKEKSNHLSPILFVFDLFGIIFHIHYLVLEPMTIYFSLSSLIFFSSFAIMIFFAKKWKPSILKYIIPLNFIGNIIIYIELIHLLIHTLTELAFLLVVPLQLLLSMLLFAKVKWFVCSLLYIVSSIYFYFRNFYNFAENFDIIWIALNFLRNFLIYVFLAYNQEKYFKQYFKTIDESYEKVKYFKLILQNMIPSPIFILDYKKNNINFLNNSAINLLEQNNIKFKPDKSFKQFETFLNSFSIVTESKSSINIPNKAAQQNSKENLSDLNELFKNFYNDHNNSPFDASLDIKKGEIMDINFHNTNVVLSKTQTATEYKKNNINDKDYKNESETKSYYEIKIIKIYWEDSICLFLLFNDHTNGFRISELINQDQYKDQVLASVSHDIRTPLHGLIGMLNIALSKTKDLTIEKYLNLAKKSASFLNYLVNDILDFSLLNFKKFRLDIKKVNFPEILDELINLFDFQAKELGLELKCCCKLKDFQPIYSDSTRIRQILLNLLSNALKFTNKGSIELILEKEINNNNDSYLYKFTVKDTGTGIRNEDLDKLFKLFGKLENPEKVNKTGIGLGLTISKKISQLLDPNGKGLQMESQYGKGSSFYFSVVCLKNDIGNINENSEESLDSSPIEINPVYCKKDFYFLEENKYLIEKEIIKKDYRILVVDDDPFSILIVKQYLKALDIESESAKNGLEAYKAYKLDIHRKICLIIMDCNMPILDGFQASLKIKKYSEKKGIKKVPICAFTANSAEKIKKKCLEAGIEFFLSKPLKKDEFLAKIRIILKDL